MSKVKKMKAPCDPGHTGAFGGRGPQDIRPKDMNVLVKSKDEDQDGKPDNSIHEELSEDRNTLFSRK